MVVDDAFGKVHVFDAGASALLGTVVLGANGADGDCSITSDGKKGFATTFTSKLHVIDLTNPAAPALAGPPNPIPISNSGEDTSITPDGMYVVASDGSNTQPVSVVSIATQTQVATLATGSDNNSSEAMSDGSVLVTSYNQSKVRRLAINGSGTLTNTGEVLSVASPMNVYGSPDAKSGFVVRFAASNNLVSFTVPGLTQKGTRTLPGYAQSGAFHPAGDKIYARTTNGHLVGYSFNSATGAIGAAPLFDVAVAASNSYFAMDTIALTPDGSAVYVSESNKLKAYDSSTGALLATITSSSFGALTGVCFTPGTPADTTPPVVTPPANVVAEATSAAGAVVNYGTATATDNVGVVSGPTCVPASGSTFALGTTTVTCSASDAAGNTGTASFTVTVVDTTPPVITAPAPLIVECNTTGGVASSDSAIQAWLNAASAVDAVDGSVPVSNDLLAGLCAVGETKTVTFSATDAAGNAASAASTITVVDTVPPTVGAITASPSSIWPANHKMTPVAISVDVSDVCDPSVTCSITSVTSNELENGLGDGDTAPDWVITGPLTLQVRAERAGTGMGRVYMIGITCTDDSGNTSTGTVTVTVPHDKGK